MQKEEVGNNFKLALFTILLGAFSGAVIWAFLRLMGICTKLLWEDLPDVVGVNWLPVAICAAGGLITGLIHVKCGDYPEELHDVLGKIKKDKHYNYKPMLSILICALLPLIFGASVGPEAGLTGVIAGLCYWVGDNVKFAKKNADKYSEIGAVVTLGSLFHIPLFGIFAVEETDVTDATKGNINIPKISKIVLYGLALGAAFLAMKGLSILLGSAGDGMPSFEYIEPSVTDYVLLLIYIPVGILLYKLYELCVRGTKKLGSMTPKVLRETICGAVIGIMALLVPVVLFSGEDQLGEISDVFLMYAPWALIGVGLLKILMTAFCINFGLKGGHFFPLIFACVCIGFGLAMTFYMVIAGTNDTTAITGHAIFAGAAVTAAMLGAQLKKPIAVSLLLLICFPIKLVLWILVAAALGGKATELISKKRTVKKGNPENTDNKTTDNKSNEV